MYLARIKHKIYKHADEIKSQKYICRKHSMIYSFCLFGGAIYVDDVIDHEFIEICGVIAKDGAYNFHVHRMIVSRYVLEVLLEYKIRSLAVECIYLNEKFLPVPLSSRNEPTENTADG